MSFHSAISQTLVFGQLLGLMPLSGVRSHEVQLKFTYKSLQFVQFCLVLAAAISFVVVVIAGIFDQGKYNLTFFVYLVVYSSNLFTVIFFFKLGRKWQKLMLTWTTTEKSLPQPEDKNFLGHQLNLRLFVIATSSLSKLSLKCEAFGS